MTLYDTKPLPGAAPIRQFNGEPADLSDKYIFDDLDVAKQYVSIRLIDEMNRALAGLIITKQMTQDTCPKINALH